MIVALEVHWPIDQDGAAFAFVSLRYQEVISLLCPCLSLHHQCLWLLTTVRSLSNLFPEGAEAEICHLEYDTPGQYLVAQRYVLHRCCASANVSVSLKSFVDGR